MKSWAWPVGDSGPQLARLAMLACYQGRLHRPSLQVFRALQRSQERRQGRGAPIMPAVAVVLTSLIHDEDDLERRSEKTHYRPDVNALACVINTVNTSV